MVSDATRRLIRTRLAAEVGRIDKSAAWRVALAYPSPYAAAMSSLGYQQIYRTLQALPAVACERVFLPDDAEHAVAHFREGVAQFWERRPVAGKETKVRARPEQTAGGVQRRHAAV